MIHKCILFTVLFTWVWSHSGVAQFSINRNSLPLWAQPSLHSLISEERDGLWLVEVESTIAATTNVRPLVTITHNFTGSNDLLGQKFVPSGQFSTGAPPLPLMPIGSKGLFVVKWDLVNKSFLSGYHGYGYDFPALEKNIGDTFGVKFPPYNEALLYAQSIERVARAPRNEQIRLLGVYTKSAMPQRSAWAIATLAESGLESAPPFLLGLASDPKIPVAGQLALDRGLASLHETRKVTWNRSNARWALWRRIVTSKSGEEQAIAVVSEIVDRGQREAQLKRVAVAKKTAYVPTIEGGRLFEWLRLGAANRNWTPSSRAFALGRVGNLSRQNVIGRGAAWNFLLPILKTHPELQAGARAADFPDAKPFSSEAIIANGALSGLAWLRPFSSQELQMLRALQTRAKTRFLRSGLDGLLKQPK